MGTLLSPWADESNSYAVQEGKLKAEVYREKEALKGVWIAWWLAMRYRFATFRHKYSYFWCFYCIKNV